MFKKFNASIVTGTATGVAVAGQVNGATLHMGGDVKKIKDLSANVTVDAETDTLTLTPKWQGSNDGSTWFNIANPGNAVMIALATGTAGADATVNRVIPAPPAIEGWRYARCSLVVGGDTGTANDTYSIAYSFNALGPSDNLWS